MLNKAQGKTWADLEHLSAPAKTTVSKFRSMLAAALVTLCAIVSGLTAMWLLVNSLKYVPMR